MLLYLSQAFHKLRPPHPPFNSFKNAWWWVLSWGSSLSTFRQSYEIASALIGNIFNTIISNPKPYHSVIWQTKFYTHTTGKFVVLQQYTEVFLNLITLDYTTLHSDRFAWRQAAWRRPLFQFTRIRGPQVSVQCISTIIKFCNLHI
jgi:hypothetical protein